MSRPKLPDGRVIRKIAVGRKDTFTQVELFDVARLLPISEGIMSVKDHDQFLKSKKRAAEISDNWWRCREYAFYRKDPKVPLGKEILWAENSFICKKLIPDVPVIFGGKEISLRKASGIWVYDSIDLLKMEEVDRNLIVVSAVDPAAVIGRVRNVDLMRNEWALTDERGLPLANQQCHPDHPDGRYSEVRVDFRRKSTGYHGSLSRSIHIYYNERRFCYEEDRRYFHANTYWSDPSRLMAVDSK
jgi:hypothetical protein